MSCGVITYDPLLARVATGVFNAINFMLTQLHPFNFAVCTAGTPPATPFVLYEI